MRIRRKLSKYYGYSYTDFTTCVFTLAYFWRYYPLADNESFSDTASLYVAWRQQ